MSIPPIYETHNFTIGFTPEASPFGRFLFIVYHYRIVVATPSAQRSPSMAAETIPPA